MTEEAQSNKTTNNVIMVQLDSKSPISELTKEQYDQLVPLLNSEKQSPLGKATKLSNDNINWVLNSGVSNHMTCNKSNLIDSQPSTFLVPIRLPNSSCIAIKKCGRSFLSPNLVLDNILYMFHPLLVIYFPLAN